MKWATLAAPIFVVLSLPWTFRASVALAEVNPPPPPALALLDLDRSLEAILADNSRWEPRMYDPRQVVLLSYAASISENPPRPPTGALKNSLHTKLLQLWRILFTNPQNMGDRQKAVLDIKDKLHLWELSDFQIYAQFLNPSPEHLALFITNFANVTDLDRREVINNVYDPSDKENFVRMLMLYKSRQLPVEWTTWFMRRLAQELSTHEFESRLKLSAVTQTFKEAIQFAVDDIRQRYRMKDPDVTLALRKLEDMVRKPKNKSQIAEQVNLVNFLLHFSCAKELEA